MKNDAKLTALIIWLVFITLWGLALHWLYPAIAALWVIIEAVTLASVTFLAIGGLFAYGEARKRIRVNDRVFYLSNDYPHGIIWHVVGIIQTNTTPVYYLAYAGEVMPSGRPAATPVQIQVTNAKQLVLYRRGK